jgi:hypothetical protein
MYNYLDKGTISHNFNNLNLPITMNPHDYGEVQVSNIIKEGDIIFERYSVQQRE